MKRSILLCLIVSLLGLIACAQTDFSTTTYTGIKRILMHERGLWTFVQQKPGLTNVEFLTFRVSPDKERVYADVPEGEPCWIKVGAPWIQNSMVRISLEIHVHSTNEINTAGWDHGKFGKGQTISIE